MKLLGPDGGDRLRAYLRSIGSESWHPLLEGWLTKLDRYRTNLAGFGEYWEEISSISRRMFHFMRTMMRFSLLSARRRLCRMELRRMRITPAVLVTR